jgi:hypothetical protein
MPIPLFNWFTALFVLPKAFEIVPPGATAVLA